MFWRRTAAVFTLCVALSVTAPAPKDLNAAIQADTSGGEQPAGRQTRDVFDMMGFLQRYGYLEEIPRSDERGAVFHSEATFTQAVSDFQEFNGLPVTGQLDQSTVNKMRAPRCGFPDKPRSPLNTSASGVPTPQNFYTMGTRWGKDTVTWKPTQLSQKMPEADQWRALSNALKYWSDVTPLKFQHTTGEADMMMKFVRGDHGDGYRNRFNGPGGILAHAFQPGEGIGGDTHFDEDEAWSLGTGEGYDLEIVAAHEFGHALGLAHSSVSGALMAPYYRYVPDLQLHTDDIQGIQALYGARRGSTTPPTPTTSTTPETTTTTPTTTTTTPTTTTKGPVLPSYCGPDFRVDAVVGGEGGTTYLFRYNKVYKVGPWGLEPGYPRYITEVFPNAPHRNVGYGVYLPNTRTHYLFKGLRVWRYTDFRLDDTYPRTWMSYEEFFRIRPSAALTFTYGASITKIFMFGNGVFWEWDTLTERMVPGYPLQTATYFVGAPLHPEGATANSNNDFFFFKGNRYYKLHNRVAVGQSLPIANNWFGYACGASSLQHDVTVDKGDNQYDVSNKAVLEEKNAARTSDLSPDQFHRDQVAPLPFDLDIESSSFRDF